MTPNVPLPAPPLPPAEQAALLRDLKRHRQAKGLPPLDPEGDFVPTPVHEVTLSLKQGEDWLRRLGVLA